MNATEINLRLLLADLATELRFVVNMQARGKGLDQDDLHRIQKLITATVRETTFS